MNTGREGTQSDNAGLESVAAGEIGSPDHRYDDATVTAAQAGDESAFTQLAARYRRELQVHCYRMLGSFDDSEDLVQETLLRAWRKLDTFGGRSTIRSWLYRIATNACLDALSREYQSRQVTTSAHGAAEISWLQPFPDRLLDQLADTDAEPDTALVAKETIELAFLIAVQHLPPRQRAVLLLRDVLGWPASDTAALLEETVPAANSALQRARITLKQHLPQRRLDWSAATEPNPDESVVMQRFIDATQRCDMAALGSLLRSDALFTMPPEPDCIAGRDAILESWKPVMVGPNAWGDWRLLPTMANRQPAVGNYVRRPGEAEFSPVALDVLTVEAGEIAAVTTFPSTVFPTFGLPSSL